MDDIGVGVKCAVNGEISVSEDANMMKHCGDEQGRERTLGCKLLKRRYWTPASFFLSLSRTARHINAANC